MRTLAIGDIHGCFTSLTTLLQTVSPAVEDKVIFLGDYIDRGPQSRQVIEHLIQRRDFFDCVFLRGNHEVMILEGRNDSLKAKLWQSYGGFEMLVNYGAEYKRDWAATIPAAHWNFLKHTDPFYETDSHIFVHASPAPDLDMPEQSDLFLYWEFFDAIQPHKSGRKIICGHTPQESGLIKDLGFAACIDTNAVRGGWLTCLDADSGEYWQANELKQVRVAKI